MNALARGLDDLEADLARGRLVHDIRALLGALHFLVRRYHDIIDVSDEPPS